MKRYTELELVSMFQQVFTGKNGEVILDWFKHMYGDKISFVPNDPHGTSFNEGQRSVYLQIQEFMKKDIKQLEKESEEDNV